MTHLADIASALAPWLTRPMNRASFTAGLASLPMLLACPRDVVNNDDDDDAGSYGSSIDAGTDDTTEESTTESGWDVTSGDESTETTDESSSEDSSDESTTDESTEESTESDDDIDGSTDDTTDESTEETGPPEPICPNGVGAAWFIKDGNCDVIGKMTGISPDDVPDKSDLMADGNPVEYVVRTSGWGPLYNFGTENIAFLVNATGVRAVIDHSFGNAYYQSNDCTGTPYLQLDLWGEGWFDVIYPWNDPIPPPPESVLPGVLGVVVHSSWWEIYNPPLQSHIVSEWTPQNLFVGSSQSGQACGMHDWPVQWMYRTEGTATFVPIEMVDIPQPLQLIQGS